MMKKAKMMKDIAAILVIVGYVVSSAAYIYYLLAEALSQGIVSGRIIISIVAVGIFLGLSCDGLDYLMFRNQEDGDKGEEIWR